MSFIVRVGLLLSAGILGVNDAEVDIAPATKPLLSLDSQNTVYISCVGSMMASNTSPVPN